MDFTESIDTVQPGMMISSSGGTSEEVLAAELTRINEATSDAAEFHSLKIEHAKLLQEQVKEAVIHARKKHSLELNQMKELHKLKVKKLKMEIRRMHSKK